MTQDWIVIAVGLAVGALVILASVALLGIVNRVRQNPDTSPGVDDVLDALTPWLYRAVLAGERAALWGFEQLDTKLEGMDKKAVADSLYALLPETLVVGGRAIPISVVKSLVPRDVFEARVKDVYDAADALIEKNKDYLKSQIAALKLPPPPTPDPAESKG